VRVCDFLFRNFKAFELSLFFFTLFFFSLSLSLFASFELRPRFRSSERDCGAG
jgi:hypothetical protein